MKPDFCSGLPGLHIRDLFGPQSPSSAYSFFASRKTYYTHSCRTALREACQMARIGVGDEVLVPAYNCGSEIDVFLKVGAVLQPYRVKETTEIDWEDFSARITERTRAALVTHFFGFPQKISRATELCNGKPILLIEDCAHSLFSSDGECELGSLGDIATFSFPKTFGVPDGGALVVNNTDIPCEDWVLNAPDKKDVCIRLLSLLKTTVLTTASRWPIIGRVLLGTAKVRNAEFRGREYERTIWPCLPDSYYYVERTNTDRGMSFLTKYLLSRINVEGLVARRRRNFKILLDILSFSKEIQPLFRDLPNGVCPLCFPAIVPDRDRCVEELNSHNIRAIPWWRGYHQGIDWNTFNRERKLKDSVMALPIHQDISESQAVGIGERLLEVVSRTAPK